MILKTNSKLSVKIGNTFYRILSVLQAAEKANTTTTEIENKLSRLHGENTQLDCVFPCQVENKNGFKFVVCNEKWNTYLSIVKPD